MSRKLYTIIQLLCLASIGNACLAAESISYYVARVNGNDIASIQRELLTSAIVGEFQKRASRRIEAFASGVDEQVHFREAVPSLVIRKMDIGFNGDLSELNDEAKAQLDESLWRFASLRSRGFSFVFSYQSVFVWSDLPEDDIVKFSDFAVRKSVFTTTKANKVLTALLAGLNEDEVVSYFRDGELSWLVLPSLEKPQLLLGIDARAIGSSVDMPILLRSFELIEEKGNRDASTDFKFAKRAFEIAWKEFGVRYYFPSEHLVIYR